MRLGMFMMPVHPPGRPMSETLAEDTAKSVLADKLGYDELWMGEHFSATTEPFPSPLMFLAGLVPQTKNLTFGTAVINLPNHHPAIVAAECAQFDHMSGGRFLMGVGSGGLASDFELFNIDPAARQRQFMESIDMIQHIWAQDPPYDITGEFWNVQIRKAIMPVAIALSMIVEMTSWTPRVVLSRAAIEAHIAPKRMATTTAMMTHSHTPGMLLSFRLVLEG